MGGLYIYLQRAGTGGRGHDEEDSWARVAGHARLTSRRSLVARFTRNQLLGVRSVRFWVTDKITRILPTNNKSKANYRKFLIVKKSKKFSFCNSIKVFKITLLLLWILSSYLKSKIQTQSRKHDDETVNPNQEEEISFRDCQIRKYTKS